MGPKSTFLIGVGALCSTLLGGVVSASAQEGVIRDPAGDMRTSAGAIAPEQSNFDIRRVTVEHGIVNVTINTEFSELRMPTEGRNAGFFVSGYLDVDGRARPPEGRFWEWRAWFTSGDPNDPEMLEVLDAEHEEVGGCFTRSNNNSIGLRAMVDYARKAITVTLPRRCLTQNAGYMEDPIFDGVMPRWVRVSVTSQVISAGRSYEDHGVNKTEEGWPDERLVQMTPRLYPTPSDGDTPPSSVDAGLVWETSSTTNSWIGAMHVAVGLALILGAQRLHVRNTSRTRDADSRVDEARTGNREGLR